MSSWRECIRKGIIIKTRSDPERATELRAMAKTRFEFWDQSLEDRFITLKVEAFYQIIMELIFAEMYDKGYNCRNHICLIAYLKKYFKNFTYEIEKIDELRKVRNEISYRGFTVSKDYLLRNEKEFKHIIISLAPFTI